MHRTPRKKRTPSMTSHKVHSDVKKKPSQRRGREKECQKGGESGKQARRHTFGGGSRAARGSTNGQEKRKRWCYSVILTKTHAGTPESPARSLTRSARQPAGSRGAAFAPGSWVGHTKITKVRGRRSKRTRIHVVGKNLCERNNSFGAP